MSRGNRSAKQSRTPLVARGNRPQGNNKPLRARTFDPPDPTGKLVVQFGHFDVEGPWCISMISQEDHVLLLRHLHAVESIRVLEVFNGDPGKDYPLANGLPNDQANDRLLELGYDDEDQISRLKFSGKHCLYGFRRGERFYALWWDPEHAIYPWKKKHT